MSEDGNEARGYPRGQNSWWAKHLPVQLHFATGAWGPGQGLSWWGSNTFTGNHECWASLVQQQVLQHSCVRTKQLTHRTFQQYNNHQVWAWCSTLFWHPFLTTCISGWQIKDCTSWSNGVKVFRSSRISWYVVCLNILSSAKELCEFP